MRPRHLPSGRQHGQSFNFPDDWTPDEALAVFALLDDLCERIWQHYQIPIQTLLREQRQTHPKNNSKPEDANDPPF
ncbi:MAG: hypothetical protein ACKVQK_10565 [Burkholderiales bacterium]